MIYIALCCHANKEGETFIGYRKISVLLHIDKGTVTRAIKRLIAYGLVIRLKEHEPGRQSVLKVYSVRDGDIQPSAPRIHKEGFKEEIKEGKDLKKKLKEQFPNEYQQVYGQK